MKAFFLNIDSAILFYELCAELKADTEEKRIAILNEMAEMGYVDNIVQTPKTKAEYLEHLSKHFNVMEYKDDHAGEQPN